MAATTMSDLPRDALVLILRAVFDAAKQDGLSGRHVSDVHQNLRSVSREWGDAADIAYIEHAKNEIYLNMDALQDPATARVRARFASLIHALCIICPRGGDRNPCKAHTTARALSSLCASPDLRRVLKRVLLDSMFCASEVAAAVSAVAVCPHLTSLECRWADHHDDGVQRDVVFASLTTLTGLKDLAMLINESNHWVRSTVPPLPDIPSLTGLKIGGYDGTFAFGGSDASLGRLRLLSLENDAMSHHEWASNDPFRLRADMAVPAAWRPHLLTSVQKLRIELVCHQNDEFVGRWVPGEYAGPVPAAAVWEPLAPTVTKLELACVSSIHRDADMETGMFAGLGALTGLRSLRVNIWNEERSPVDFGLAHFPRLTFLSVCNYRGPPIDLARFPRLVHVEIEAKQPEPLAVSSVAELRRLASLHVWGGPRFGRPLGEQEFKPRLNLAQLFGGGRPLAALTELSFDCVMLSWDAAAAAGAPAASEFAACVAALLPSLRSLEIKEYVDMDDGVREFVVPAVRALGRG